MLWLLLRCGAFSRSPLRKILLDLFEVHIGNVLTYFIALLSHKSYCVKVLFAVDVFGAISNLFWRSHSANELALGEEHSLVTDRLSYQSGAVITPTTS